MMKLSKFLIAITNCNVNYYFASGKPLFNEKQIFERDGLFITEFGNGNNNIRNHIKYVIISCYQFGTEM